MLPSAASRGKSLTQASFAAKRAARLAARPGPVAAVGELLRGEEPREIRGRRLAQQAFDARDLDGVDAAAVGRGAACPPCRGQASGGANEQRGVGAGEAAAEDQRDVAARRLRLAPTPGRPAHSRIERGPASAMPGTSRASSAASASTASTMPAAAIRWPNAHLNAVTGGGVGAEHRADRRRFRDVGLRACRCRGRRSCRRRPARAARRRAPARIARATPSPSSRIATRPSRFAGVAAAQHFAQHRRRCGSAAEASVSSISAPAPSPNRLPSCARVERAQRLRREQAQPVVVEHHLRLDRRVVADRHRAIGLAGAQRLHRLDHRQRAADAVVGDAGVRALQAVPDADVAEHVVGQRAQQPHRVDGVGELARRTSAGRRRPRSSAESSRTGSGSCRRPSRRRRRCGRCRSRRAAASSVVAVREDAGAVDRAARGVQAEEIGAADQLVQLAVVDQRARVEIGDLAGDRAPASRWCPTAGSGRSPTRPRAPRRGSPPGPCRRRRRRRCR